MNLVQLVTPLSFISLKGEVNIYYKVPKKAIKHLQWLEKDEDEEQPAPAWAEDFQKKLKAHNKKMSEKKRNKNIKTKK